MYKSKQIAKIIPYKKASISYSPSTMVDVELVKIFETSIKENTPYLIELHRTIWLDWIKRHKEYWEKQKGLSIAYHVPTHNIFVVPIK